MSTQDTTYNGWKNYATWGVALVLDNDQGTYTEVREIAKLHKHSGDDAGRYRFAEWLKDYTEELCGLEDDADHLSLMARQVIQAGLSDVDWDEIASNVLSES